ncbi:hypothetical protein A2U01_0097733, partial [Trifolium medium]|nr:hypothetical protein [Trifolium medium]
MTVGSRIRVCSREVVEKVVDSWA